MRTFTVERDAKPPQVWLNAPAGVVTGPITVTWGAADAQAGVAYYDLDVSIDGGPWQRVLTRTTATTYQVTSLPTTHATFRLTATDHVGNAASALARTSISRITKYYHHGGARVALRTTDAGGSVVYWLHTDHLGSLSLVTDHASRITAQQRFLPYGGERYSEGTFPTDIGFTGHRGQAGLGLVFMRARYYHPYLNRWIQPDTIVPDPANPQSLNRFAYVLANPVRYTDPTGHCAPEDEECNEWADRIEREWEGQITVVRCIGDWDGACVHWTADEMEMLYETLDEYSDQYLDIPLILIRVGDEDYAGLHTSLIDENGSKSSVIRIADDAWHTPPAMGLYDLFDVFAKRDYFQGTIAHELTHAAVWSHPELLNRWIELTDIGTHNLAIGLLYDWSYYDDLREENEDAWRETVQEELFAMAVSALMYDPWWNQGHR